MHLKRLSKNWNDSLAKVTVKNEIEKQIIDTAFEYITFSLRKHFSEKLGKL
jgi:hypothetical protein